jgi:NAD(P)H-hydrate epimerase
MKANGPVPILSVAGMRAWEQATWDAGIRSETVIGEVGKALAARIRREVRDRAGDDENLLLLGGVGHNGDDVREAREHLRDLAFTYLTVRDPVADWPEVMAALASRPALVVDGLFGIGLNRDLGPDWVRLIRAIGESACRVLAVDVPSGLDADTGEVRGAVLPASVTWTVGAPKRGLLEDDAARWVGRLEVSGEVGLIPWHAGLGGHVGWWGREEEFGSGLPLREAGSHKGDHGHVLVMAGSPGYAGAAVLVARGALRARPGLVSVVTSAETWIPVSSQLAAAMVHGWKPGWEMPGRVSALVMGPGLAPSISEEWKRYMQWVWKESPIPVVADAGALEWVGKLAGPTGALRVITPHPGEAARLLGCTAAEVQRDRWGALRRLSEAVPGRRVILKGRGTLVGDSAGVGWWNPSGNPGMAQGGSGDVLAGFIGGLLAQTGFASEPDWALRGAVFHHGRAADRLEAAGRAWDSEDLAREIRWSVGGR